MIVLDTNILISALIRDSFTREVIVHSGMSFCYPEISLHELREHKDIILKKSGLSEGEYEKILTKLLEYVALVPMEKIAGHLDEAKQIMSAIDPDDVVFIATALCDKDSMIWSDDRHFEKQNKVKVLKTKDFTEFMKQLKR